MDHRRAVPAHRRTVVIDEQACHAPPAQLDGEQQPRRPGPDDEDLRVRVVRRGHRERAPWRPVRIPSASLFSSRPVVSHGNAPRLRDPCGTPPCYSGTVPAMKAPKSSRLRFAVVAVLLLATALAVLVPSSAAARDCGKKPQQSAPDPVPAQARELFSLMKDAPTAVSEKRRTTLCGAGHTLNADPAQARRITSPMGRRGAWFLVPGTTGMVVDENGGGSGATYAAIRQRGWFGSYIGDKILGAAVDGYDSITGSGPNRAGNEVTFTAPIRHNVFVLHTPGANAMAISVTLNRAAAASSHQR